MNNSCYYVKNITFDFIYNNSILLHLYTKLQQFGCPVHKNTKNNLPDKSLEINVVTGEWTDKLQAIEEEYDSSNGYFGVRNSYFYFYYYHPSAYCGACKSSGV